MKGRPVNGGDRVDRDYVTCRRRASMKGRPVKGGDTTHAVGILSQRKPR